MAQSIVFKQFFRINCFHPSGYFLLSGKKHLRSMSQQPTVKDISFDSLKKKVLSKNIIVIDVREPIEIKDVGKIPHSVNIPLGQIGDAFQLPKLEFRTKYGIEKPEVSDDFVISCRSGKRATNAFIKLFPLGYENALVYIGSFQDWQEKGGPVEKE